MANTLSLSDLLNKPFLGELTEDEHDAILLSWMLVTNPDPTKEYMRMTFSVKNGNAYQDFTRNMFLRDVSIALSHIRRQLNKANEVIDPKSFLNELRDNKTPLKIWITYPIVSSKSGAKRVQNLYFQPPREADSSSQADNMEIPE